MSLGDPALFDVSNGSIEGGDGVLHWHINNGQTSRLELKPGSPFFERWRDYGLLCFDFNVASGEISALDVNDKGQVNGPREHLTHNWSAAVITTPKKVWHSRVFELARPNWLPWNQSDENLETTTGKFLRFEALGIAPDTIVELRNLRLVPTPILLKPDFELPVTWPVRSTLPNGDTRYTLRFEVVNAGGHEGEIGARIVSQNEKFKVALAVDKVKAAPGGVARFVATADISAADIAATPELYAEDLKLEFFLVSAPGTAWPWQGKLVRPLTPGYEKQVAVAADDVAFLKAKVAANDEAALQMLGWKKLQAVADKLESTKLLEIPRGNTQPANDRLRVPGNPQLYLEPGAFMSEAVNEKAGFHEAFTPLAGQVWKEYLGYGGATEKLGQAYLLSGDEKYARKAVELFSLYGRQYSSLQWGGGFNAKFIKGPTTLADSRVAIGSTYGSNWYFKWHCKLLAMTANSPAWTPEIKQKIYDGWALPYALEIAKFEPGVSNMTDITNHNLLLLGLFFDDATMVHQALLSDAGLVTRLNDISDDGFSAEGRPINYQYAGMDEYIPALTYLQRSGLKVSWPRDRLLRAFQMPYRRANLLGQVPVSGDSGYQQQVGPNPLADALLELFPNDASLAAAGKGSTLAAQRYRLEHGVPDKDSWKALLETTPRLFPDAGLAVLRSGSTPETQIMATLDYGRNIFHAALDRNQITLLAFGRTFTQGTGSIYNAPTSGLARDGDAKLNSFIGHGSLGHNLVLVDGLDQQPAIGKLLAWSGDPKNQFAVARVDGIAPGVSHTRGLVLSNGVLVLLDRIESKEEHTYDWAFHNFGALTIAPPYAPSTPTAKFEGAANYENISDLQQLQGAGVLAAQWDLSNQILDKSLWPKDKDKDKQPIAPPAAIQSLNFWQLPPRGEKLQTELFTGTTGMNNPNTKRIPDRAPSVFHRVRGKSFDLATVLEPRADGQSKIKSVTADGKGRVLIIFAGGTKASFDLDELIKAGIQK
jgi:hypothetical protein